MCISLFDTICIRAPTIAQQQWVYAQQWVYHTTFHYQGADAPTGQKRPQTKAKETSQTRRDSGLALEEQHYNLLLTQWTEAIKEAYGTPPETLRALPAAASPPVRPVSLEGPGPTVELLETRGEVSLFCLCSRSLLPHSPGGPWPHG